ncbi:ABC transporter, ATP-binding protein [Ancylostoma ceylanicum]|uniref:ABC transporter, ATP-binding protein n=1 Tax=Ancylostoma ceylanicum TaxID=53326 RepID=A0A0D6LAB8_9BILA|nr:ABC transporter, ATP-binding protein [Ancylostoma ceylanicum]
MLEKAMIKDNKEKGPTLPSVVGCLFSMFRWEFLTATALKVTSDVLQFANPFLLHQLIGFVSQEVSPLWIGLSYSILMFAASEVRSFVLNAYFYIMMRMGIKFQTVLTAAVYKKTLKLSNSARRDKTVGEIVNLMAIDVERFQMITPQIQQFWSCPFQIALALTYLFITLGYSAAPGVIIMVIFLPTNIVGSIIVKKWQIEQMKLKDERTKMVNEVLNGIKVIKLYAWEVPMEQLIDEIRQKELILLRKSYLVRNVIDSFNTASPFLVAFVSLTLFNQLRSPMTMIALLIGQMVQAVVSNKRLKQYFTADELDPDVVERDLKHDVSKDAIEFENFSATWDCSQSRSSTLKDINFNAARGALIAVVGKVGCGKSSLLSALLGNCLFTVISKNQYVLNACALKPDLKILTNGDMTEIGEKGINLSGGQKARISLARAVYQDFDVYLLDDPLSAVDAHVGRHIFENVLGPNGLLRDKTRILVTHRLSYVKPADEIVVLEDGQIIEIGRYNDLIKQRGVFAKFVEEYKSKSEEDEEQEGVEIEQDSDLGKVDVGGSTKSLLSSHLVKEDGGKLIEKESVEKGNFALADEKTKYSRQRKVDVVPKPCKGLTNMKTIARTKRQSACVWECMVDLVRLSVICTLIVIVISTPIFVVVILPLAIIYYFFLRFYVPTSRQLKRLESIHRSPIYSHFSETIQGAASVRAFNKVDEFRNNSGNIVDAFIRCKYSNVASNRWLAIRLEFIGNLVIFFAALFAVISKELGWVTSPGIIGVSITYALNVTEVLNFAVRQISEIEANIVAVERIHEYTVSPTEAPWEIPQAKPPVDWPSHGCVKFSDYSTRYREGLDLVLRGISADVHEGEKIGIVGRTGAGKSSFALALFRMIEPAAGKILIDDVDIAELGLHDLRGNLTIIPQDPVLFSGTLRFNLDPFEAYTDSEIWSALELANLKAHVSGFSNGLDHTISEGGENISVGQRQLVCLARAVLRNTRVLVLDEATAAIDVTTDAVIQATIREQFVKSTVFTIAHRLNTIMDYDRIMVLENGRIIEFDSPSKLLENPDSAFARMVEDSESESRKA